MAKPLDRGGRSPGAWLACPAPQRRRDVDGMAALREIGGPRA